MFVADRIVEIADQVAAHLPERCAAVALIADDNVNRLHGDRVAGIIGRVAPVTRLTFPAGEGHKTRATKELLEDSMLAGGLGRDCAVVALGGGVTSDLAGFAAGTYQRGVPWLVVPTSLLAAVDASLGGKVGVNTEAGKNLVGLLHQPRAVVIDVDLIATLPAPEVDNGLAEMAKHAVIADRSHLHELVAAVVAIKALDPAALRSAIRRSVEIKAAVVGRDTGEQDLRQVLNFGHTIGHGVEAVSGWRIGHGCAVAIGMGVEADISCRLRLMDVAEREIMISAFTDLGLPVGLGEGLDPAALLEATRSDKKGRAGRPRYALPTRIGEMVGGPEGYTREASDEVVLAALKDAAR